MKILPVLMLLVAFETYLCLDIKVLFEKINKKTEKFNAIAAEIAWESTVNPRSPGLPIKSSKYQKDQITWQQNICDQLATLHNRHLLNSTQSRQTYLLCRGPKYTFNEARLTSHLYEELQTIYTEAEVCFPTEKKISSANLTQLENAISEYLSSIKNFIEIEHFDKYSVEFAAKITDKDKIQGNVMCLRGEDDFQNLMTSSRNDAVLAWLWFVWREKVGPPMKEPYRKLVQVENIAARRNGYSDIGASWRDEQEMPNMRQVCRRLYDRIRPLYTLLHGVVRFYLRREYGSIVAERGPIPAHLLGDLSSQNWEPLLNLIVPTTINFDDTIKKLNWTVEHMVKRAEDFYQSLGLPPMTNKFWSKSIFKRNNMKTRCHGSAADMFNKNDFRLISCLGTTMEDFYVLHHELGHIQYYMTYEHQPALFRQANAAFHEAIGDTIMHAVMTPQHLHRLRLINDSLLYDTSQESDQNIDETDKTIFNLIVDDVEKHNLLKDNFYNEIAEHINIKEDLNVEDDLKIETDDMLLLKQALNKIPQIPFSLLIDEFRWKYFEGDFTNLDVNEAFWQMALELQGIAPPGERESKYFDVGAKFHVPDNTPYIRYFLGSFLQHQLFESLCKAAVFGRRHTKYPLPDSIVVHRCDIYGSKSAGKVLKDIMSRGHSQHWQQILQETIGQSDIFTAPLERYYRPLYKLLTKLVRVHRIPIGW